MASDKREQILLAAIRLFAEKGFHSTSIQEIADAAGVAKGSTYLYFKSKDDIMLSIFNDYYVKIFDEIMYAPAPGVEPRDKFKARIRMQLEKFSEFRDFIKMQMREQFIHQNEEVKKAAMRMRIRGVVWMHDQIVEMYGEAVRPWALDCTHMFQAIIGGYMGMMIMHGLAFDLEEMAEFLMARLDDLAHGLMKGGQPPIMQAQNLAEFLRCNPMNQPENKLQTVLREIREQVQEASSGEEAVEDLLSSLQVLEEELQKEKPKRVIVQGMLTMLQHSGITGMKKLVKQLQAEAAAVLERTADG